MANKSPNIEALNDYNALLKQKNKKKIINALDYLMNESESVNISKIAKVAGLSRSTIYRDDELRTIIDTYRETSVLRRNRQVKFEKEQTLERAAKSKLKAVMQALKVERDVIRQLKAENIALKQHVESLTQKYSNIRTLGCDKGQSIEIAEIDQE